MSVGLGDGRMVTDGGAVGACDVLGSAVGRIEGRIVGPGVGASEGFLVRTTAAIEVGSTARAAPVAAWAEAANVGDASTDPALAARPAPVVPGAALANEVVIVNETESVTAASCRRPGPGEIPKSLMALKLTFRATEIVSFRA